MDVDVMWKYIYPVKFVRYDHTFVKLNKMSDSQTIMTVSGCLLPNDGLITPFRRTGHGDHVQSSI